MSIKSESQVRKKVRTFADDMKRVEQGPKSPQDKKPTATEIPSLRKTNFSMVNGQKFSSLKNKKVNESLPVANSKVISLDQPVQQPPSDKRSSLTQVPAFHEVQKQSKKPNLDYESTIITDTKDKRFRLIPSLSQALQGWFKKSLKKRADKNPVYTVPSSQSRSRVVKEATTKTGAVFTAKNDTLRIQIQNRRKKLNREKNDPSTEAGLHQSSHAKEALLPSLEAEAKLTENNTVKPFSKTDRSPLPIPQYHPEEIEANLTQPHQARVITSAPENNENITVIKNWLDVKPDRSTPPSPELATDNLNDDKSTITTPEILSEIVPSENKDFKSIFKQTKESSPANRETDTQASVTISTLPDNTSNQATKPALKNQSVWKDESSENTTTGSETEINRSNTERETPWSLPDLPSMPTPSVSETNIDERTKYVTPLTPNHPEVSEIRSKTLTRLKNSNTNTLTLAFFLAILVVTVSSYSLFAVINPLKNSKDGVSQAPTTSSVLEPVLSQSTIKPVFIEPEDLADLVSIIQKTAATGSPQTSELPVVSLLGEEISSSYLFKLLQFNTLPELRLSIKSARFVSINNQAPSLVIKYIDHTTVLGSFLVWESSLATDFAKIYNLETLPTNVFVDDVIDGYDVRVLLRNNRVVLIYGFIENEYAIISANTSDFSQIIKQINKN